MTLLPKVTQVKLSNKVWGKVDCEVPNYTTLRCSCCMNNTLGSIQLLNSLSDNCYFSGKEIWKIQLKLLLKQFSLSQSALCVLKKMYNMWVCLQ